MFSTIQSILMSWFSPISDTNRRVAELTQKLTEVELSKAEMEKKAKHFETEIKTLKKTKGFTPVLEGLQVCRLTTSSCVTVLSVTSRAG